jgi:hypothetical protein
VTVLLDELHPPPIVRVVFDIGVGDHASRTGVQQTEEHGGREKTKAGLSGIHNQ